MKIIKNIKDMQALSRRLKAGGKAIGFVPTMGALHEGHLSLVKRSKDENDVTVVSIFINPTQFGPDEDFQRYPRDMEGDSEKLSALDVGVLLMPESGEMYPEGYSTSIDIGSIGRILCGGSRPGHFNGVATVVAKLFNIVVPDRAYFGQKDFQQTAVLKKLVEELDFDMDIVVCPIVRETDGLAMSSRNSYLNPEERKAAAVLFKTLKHGEKLILTENLDSADDVREAMEKLIRSEHLAGIDYIDIVNLKDLGSVQKITLPAAILLAVKIGNIRLIDNIIVNKH
ncbi:MAG: pantoate--beta-alanine ligase [Thermodesulfovibrionia bacterium]|nr:pantoate--beta-alanine ligase [Thermodesulfovibrionia bacterium]